MSHAALKKERERTDVKMKLHMQKRVRSPASSLPLDEVTPTSPDSIGSILWILISRTCKCWSNFALISHFCIVFLPLKSFDSKHLLCYNSICLQTTLFAASLAISSSSESQRCISLIRPPVRGRPELTLTESAWVDFDWIDCKKPPGLIPTELHVRGQLGLTFTVRG